MNRYAVQNMFGIEGLNIAWYGVIVAAGFAAGILLALRRAKAAGLQPVFITDFALVLIPVCIICARAYYVLFRWQEEFAAQPLKLFAVWEGGLAIYGGVIGGVITAALFCKRRGVRFLAFTDVAIPSLILGQAVGRWGNFVNQEAYGREVLSPEWQFFPAAVYIDRLEQWRQATFFYESAWNVLLLIAVLLVTWRAKKRGFALALYCVGYGLGRFLIEGLRSDSLYLLPGLRVSQLISGALILLGAALAVYIFRLTEAEGASILKKNEETGVPT